MEHVPNYSEYTYAELLDVEKNINREKYPERYETIKKLLDDYSLSENKSMETEEQKAILKYSTFWPRFVAAIVDGIIFALVLYVECLIFGIEYNTQDSLLQAVNGLQICVYAIFMHGYYGQTLGKMVTDVKVLNHETETAINLRQALRRESVNLIINTLWITLLLTIVMSLVTTGSISSGLTNAILVFSILAMIWAISEFVTMLFNDKRRALHDFIGKTVVVRV